MIYRRQGFPVILPTLEKVITVVAMQTTISPRSLTLLLSILVITTASGTAGAEDDTRTYQLQHAMGYFSAYQMADPFIDLTKAGNNYWKIQSNDGSSLGYGEALTQGYLDPETGLPVRVPPEGGVAAGVPVLYGMTHYPNYYAGAYTVEWDGDAYGFLRGQPRDLQRRIGTNKLSFYARPENDRGLGLRFSRIGSEGLKSIRLYRDEHKKLIEAGEIWNPAFIKHMRKYDVIRTMDFQRINDSPVTKFSEVARPEDSFYTNALKPEWPAPPRYGMPYEILFDLAEKTGAALWLHIPPMVGSPLHPAHPSLRNEKNRVSVTKVSDMAHNHAQAIIDSPEWDIFAKELADRLIASNYAADKPLYIEIGNEIWNTGGAFALNTLYYQGIGRAINKDWAYREAYGVLLAQFANLFENELKKRGVSYNVTYVLASHTPNPHATRTAIRGFKYQLQQMQADADALIAKTGITLTTYTRCSRGFAKNRFGRREGAALTRAWEAAIDENPEELKRELRDYCVNKPELDVHNVGFIVNNWHRHNKVLQRQGFRLIGAYEGGSHDRPAQELRASRKFNSWWIGFQWGPYGADIVRQMNLAIIEAFPGVMISDFDSMGVVGDAPWLEGHYAHETDLMRVWDEFARPQNKP